MSVIRAFLFSVLVTSAAHAVEPDSAELGCEGAFLPIAGAVNRSGAVISGALPPGWKDNSGWADADVVYTQEHADPHGGASALGVDITRFSSGAVQLVRPVTFKAGVGIRFSVWLRGRAGQNVGLLLRQTDAPWATYASSSAQLSAEWQEFRVQGVPPTDEAGSLMIRAGEPMRFQVDDVRIEDLNSLVSDARPRLGNQISGGSFETIRPPFGWTTRQQGDPDWQWDDLHQRIDNEGRVGAHSLRIDLPAAGARSETCSPVFMPNGNRALTASVWVKASLPGSRLRVSIDNTQLASDAQVGTSWQRVTLSGVVPFVDWARLRVAAEPDPQKPLSVWLDGAMVEERAEASPEYQAATPIEVALDLDLPGHVVVDQQTAAASLALAPAPPAGATLDLEVEDLLGGTTPLPVLALPASQVILPEIAAHPRGMFKLRLVVRDAAGTALSAPTELVYARLPKARELAPDESYFGLHIPLSPDYIALARATGMRWVRFHDASMIGKWSVAEPEPGQWRFFDRQVDAAHRAGLGIIGMLDGAPARVSTAPRSGGYWGLWNLPDQPGAIDQWRNYVRTVTSHYRGRIDHWEVWNEPWGEWWQGMGGTPAGYVELLKVAYVQAKEANPASVILGVGAYRGNAWTDAVLKLSGTGCYDGFSFHDYNDSMYGGASSFAQRQVDDFTKAQAAVGTAKPQWNTEGGVSGCGSWYVPAIPGMAPRNQLAYAVRYDVTMLAAGVKAYLMYAVHTNGALGDTDTRVVEHDRAVKPVLAGRAVLASLIDGVGTPLRSEPSPGVDCYTFPADPTEEGRSVAAWWSYDGQTHRVQVPPGVTVLDVLGSPKQVVDGVLDLDQEPIYLITRK